MRYLFAPLLAAALAWSTSAHAKGQQAHYGDFGKPRIDVAFLLDTTGSMTELIEGAKIKIWSIATEMLQAQITPDIRMGLIGYRDRGDAYITRRFDLTEDIDEIYGALLQFHAGGGGDRPESVNQALHEAVNHLNWHRDPAVLRLVFLVGDSPPKMNYYDDVKYPQTASRALQNDIVINTVLAGTAYDTASIWKEIAALTHGQFAAIPQSGNMQVIESPYDQDLQRLNQRLDDSAIIYGNQRVQSEARRKLEQYHSAPAAVRADKSTFSHSKGEAAEIITGRGELINDLAKNRVKLEDLSEEELPAELRTLKPAEQESYIREKQAERQALRAEIDALVEKRNSYLDVERKRQASSGKDSFDGKIGEIIREQGATKGIVYE